MGKALTIQMVIFLVVLGLLIAAYQYSPAFRDLTKDVIESAGFTQEQLNVAEAPAKAPANQAKPVQADATANNQAPKTAVSSYPAYSKPDTPRQPAKPADDYRPLDEVVETQPVINQEQPVEASQVPEASQPVVPVTPAPVVEANNKAKVSASEPETAAAQSPAPSSTESQPSPEEQALTGLTMARQAWQDGDANEAISRYQSLMKDYPNHPDFAGELGNIYFAQGNRPMAVNAYSETFMRLMRMEDYQRAWQILSVIRQLDYQRASQLERQFMR